MKIAAISDVHGNLGALDAVLADIATRSVDVIVNLGDILSGSLRPRETAQRLMPLELPTIRGNHERQLLESSEASMGMSDRYAARTITSAQRDWIRALPATLQYTDDIFLCHGSPDSDLGYLLDVISAGECVAAPRELLESRLANCRSSLVFCGHSHVPRIAYTSRGQTVVNPGSVGLQAYEDPEPLPHRVQVGAPHARYAVAEGAGTAWSVDLLAVPYDWDAAARLAERHERPEWARALRTGYL